MSGPSKKALDLALDAAEGDGRLTAARAIAAAHNPALGLERSVCLRDVADWLRHIDRLDEVPGARVGLPEKNPLWDAATAMEREFGGGS